MIVVVAPNPALDRTVAVDRFVPGDVTRARWVHEAAGGKGLNVARIATALGDAVVACAPLGGLTGRRVEALACGEGLDVRLVPIEGECRTCTVLVSADGSSTVVTEPGAALSDAEWADLVAMVERLAADADAVTISGSMPGGADGRIVELAGAARRGRAMVWVDASGGALRAAMDVPSVSIKVNADEARAVVAGSSAVELARSLLDASGATAVVVTDGANGAGWADISSSGSCAAPRVEVANATGSGDAFLAGLVGALGRGERLASAVRYGVAVAAAAAMSATVSVDAALVAELAGGMRASADTTSIGGGSHG